MKRILASCAGGLLVAAAACNGAWAGEPLDSPFAVPSAAAPVPTVAAPETVPETIVVPAVSNETVGSVPAPPAEGGHDAAAAPVEGGESHGAPTTEEHEAGPSEEHSAEAHAEPAPTRAPMPFDIIRTLQFLQDQVARGNGRAIRVQAMLLRRFGPVFVGADPGVWTDGRNRRAAILFALSGGTPEVLRQLLAAGAFDDATKPLAEGALAYVTNNLPKAEKLLTPIDLSQMEPGLAAQLSLALGQMKQNDHPADAIVYLDRARLLAPGGLVEEAALRLEIVLAQKVGDPAKADRLARQYFDRFSRSSYAGNFLARFATVYSDRPPADAAASLAQVLDITARVGAADRRALLLAISRRSLVAGNLELARLTGAEALRIGGTDGEEQQRGNLYAAAAGLVAGGSQAAEELRAIDRAQLHPADIGILDAATSVLSGMEAPIVSSSGLATVSEAEPSAVVDRAQKLLDAVAGDLGAMK